MGQTQHLTNYRTTVHDRDGITVVTYVKTAIASFDGETITFDSGGWRTTTTKANMNRACNQFGIPCRVFQKKHEWYVDTPKGTVPFEDNMTVNYA